MRLTCLRFAAYFLTVGGLVLNVFAFAVDGDALDVVTLLGTAISFFVVGLLVEQTRQIKENARLAKGAQRGESR